MKPAASGPKTRLASDLADFAKRIGHEFRQPDLLVRAVTHSSLSSSTRPSNERLEFLGDRVLGLSIATALFQTDDRAVAREIGLGEVLKLGRSEMMSGGRRKEALLGDAMEAVIAAIYLDAGFEAARAVVLRLWGARIASAGSLTRDAKSALQEWAQARGLPPPVYVEVGRSGPDHQPVFRVEAQLASGEAATGEAPGKRQAEQSAAAALLARAGGAG